MSDDELRELLARANEIIDRTLPEVRSKELRTFIRKHKDVPEFKDLVFTLILLAETPGWSVT